MGGFKKIEDRPTPKEVYNWRVYMLAIICGCGALTFGYDGMLSPCPQDLMAGAFIGTTIARPSFKLAMGIDKMTKAEQTAMTTNLTSTFTGSAWFGAVFAWPCMERFGRKRPMQVSAFLFNLGAILMTVTTHNLGMIYAGRAITGFAVGVLTATIPTFIGEFSPPAIRGQLTGFFEIAYQIGSLVGFWINFGITSHMDVTSNTSWRVAMAVQLIPGGMLAVGSIVLKESPGWLLRKGREEEALHVLSYVRQLPEDHHYLQEEVAMLRVVIEEERKFAGGKKGMIPYLRAFGKELKVPHVRHRMFCLFAMFILMNFSGAVVLNCKSCIASEADPRLLAHPVHFRRDRHRRRQPLHRLLRARQGRGSHHFLPVDRRPLRPPRPVAPVCRRLCDNTHLHRRVRHRRRPSVQEGHAFGGRAARGYCRSRLHHAVLVHLVLGW
jgi:MFS family permease